MNNKYTCRDLHLIWVASEISPIEAYGILTRDILGPVGVYKTKKYIQLLYIAFFILCWIVRQWLAEEKSPCVHSHTAKILIGNRLSALNLKYAACEENWIIKTDRPNTQFLICKKFFKTLPLLLSFVDLIVKYVIYFYSLVLRRIFNQGSGYS